MTAVCEVCDVVKFAEIRQVRCIYGRMKKCMYVVR